MKLDHQYGNKNQITIGNETNLLIKKRIKQLRNIIFKD